MFPIDMFCKRARLQYKIIGVKELADYIMTMAANDEVFFASTWDEETEPTKLDGSCCEDWYGVKVINAFDYKLVVLAQSGGDKVWAFRLNAETIETDIKYYLRTQVGGTTVYQHVVLEHCAD